MNNVMFLDQNTITRFSDALTNSPGYSFFKAPNYKSAILAGEGVKLMNVTMDLNSSFLPSSQKIVLKRKNPEKVDDLLNDFGSIFALSKRMIGGEDVEMKSDKDFEEEPSDEEFEIGEASGGVGNNIIVQESDQEGKLNVPKPYNNTQVNVPNTQNVSSQANFTIFDNEIEKYKSTLIGLIQIFQKNQEARLFTGVVMTRAFKLPGSSKHSNDVLVNAILQKLESAFTNKQTSVLEDSDEIEEKFKIIYNAFFYDKIDFFGSDRNFGADVFQYHGNNYILRRVDNDIVLYYIPSTEFQNPLKSTFNKRKFISGKLNPENYNMYDVSTITTQERYLEYIEMIKQIPWHY